MGKLLHSLRHDGVKPTSRRIIDGLMWRTAPLWQWGGGKIRDLRLFIDARFDRKFGVDTGGQVGSRNLDISDEQKDAAFHYEPTPEAALRAIFKALPVAHERYSFVDYGSGKGRVLLLASEYPFKRIIGIEVSRQLNDIANRNLKVWKSPRQRCFQIESHCMDAREFVLPSGPLVLFFFTPFRPPISNQVIDRVRESVAADPRPIQIVHYGTNEDFRSLLSTLGFERRRIYSGRPLSAQHSYEGTLFGSAP